MNDGADEQAGRAKIRGKTRSWAQADGENDREYARFVTWLSMSDRTYKTASETLGLTTKFVSQLAAQWDWTDRAAAYDLEQARILQQVTSRDRRHAAATLTRIIREMASHRATLPPEDRDVNDIRSLTMSLRNITPALEVTAVSGDEVDVAAIARRAREITHGPDPT